MQKKRIGKKVQRDVAGNVSVARIQRNLRPVPDRFEATLRYAQRVTLTMTSGALQDNVFAGNGLYDPDITGSGHQPTGFDQLMALYTRYCVIKSKCTVKLSCVGTTAPTQNAWAVLVPETNVSTAASIEEALAMPFAKSLDFNINYVGSELTQELTTSKFMGIVQRNLDDEDVYQGTSGANPSRLWYWSVYCMPVDASSSMTLYALVELTYTAIFSMTADLNTS